MDITASSLPEGTIRLRDGRQLAYAEYGDPQGKPVFFFHGTPGSRLFHHPDTTATASTGARIIAVDRPGFGRSDFKAGRNLLDWPGDVLQLADDLNIDQFTVMGYCGGGPYALACASRIPDRVVAVGLVSSMAPLDHPQMTRGMHGMGHVFFSTEHHLPPLAKLGCQVMCTTWRNNPSLYFRSQINGFRSTEEAQRMLPQLKHMMTADFLEAVRAGSQGITWDLQILARPWGFHLHTIQSDVLLWHGEHDTQAPVVMGKRLASAIAHCHATFFPGEGHWAIHSHWQEILTALVQNQPAAHHEAVPQVIVVPAQAGNNGSEMAVSPACSDAGIAEIAADAPQGLQPMREAALVAARESSTSSSDVPLDAAAIVSPEPETAPEAPKAAARKPKTQRRRAAAATEARAKVSSEPVPVEEPPRKSARKPAERRTAAVAEAPTQASKKPRSTPENTKAMAPKMAKRSAPAAADKPVADSSEPKMPIKAKASAKKAGKPISAAVEPLPAAVTGKPEAEPEPAEPVLAKSSSRRKSAKEAVLV